MKKEGFDFILSSGEDQFVEFKESYDKSLAKEIVAFANAKGGKIYLGVTDKGVVKGIKITNLIKSQIQDISRNCDPSIVLNISSYKNKVLIIKVSEGNKKPYSCSQGFFMRIGANSQKLSRDEILSFAYTEGKLAFDEQVSADFIYPDDFDERKFYSYLKEANLTNINDDKILLINLGIAKKVKDKILLNTDFRK